MIPNCSPPLEYPLKNCQNSNIQKYDQCDYKRQITKEKRSAVVKRHKGAADLWDKERHRYFTNFQINSLN